MPRVMHCTDAGEVTLDEAMEDLASPALTRATRTAWPMPRAFCAGWATIAAFWPR
jgi:hypothetical protein